MVLWVVPAKSEAQRQLFAIAEHEPGKLHKGNKGLLKMSKSKLSEFVRSKGKKLVKHIHSPKGGKKNG